MASFLSILPWALFGVMVLFASMFAIVAWMSTRRANGIEDREGLARHTLRGLEERAVAAEQQIERAHEEARAAEQRAADAEARAQRA
ncbi:MAG TPA: hypothetical protein ENK57_14495, partial [Polyangiaceae bacterium]|nr:hypothetical protein [Polyangiaceae bacterium]